MRRWASRTGVLEVDVGVHQTVAEEKGALEPAGEIDRRALLVGLGIILGPFRMSRCTRMIGGPVRDRRKAAPAANVPADLNNGHEGQKPP
jgi:hypothetical protein